MNLHEAIDTVESALVATQHDGADTGDIADGLRALEEVREYGKALVKGVDGLLDVIDATPTINIPDDDPIDDAFTAYLAATGQPHPPLNCWDDDDKARYLEEATK